MPHITLTQVASVASNPNQAALIINENFARIAEAFEKCLFTDGREPNQMEADLDLNSFTLRNVILGEDVTVEAVEITPL